MKDLKLEYYKACNNLCGNKDLRLFLDTQYDGEIKQKLRASGMITELEANTLKGVLSYIEGIPKTIEIGSKKFLKEGEEKPKKIYV